MTGRPHLAARSLGEGLLDGESSLWALRTSWMYWSMCLAASVSMLDLMVSSHLLTSLEPLSDGALFSSGLVVLGVNV